MPTEQDIIQPPDAPAQPDLTADEARALTDQIKTKVSEFLPLIREAYERRADIALGYRDWASYCDAEMGGLRLPVGERREAIRGLHDAGMSQRAIASTVGVGVGTVNRDLSGVPIGTPEEAGDSEKSTQHRTVGLDGKNYGATRAKLQRTHVEQPQAQSEPDASEDDLQDAPAENGLDEGEDTGPAHPKAPLFMPPSESVEDGDARRDQELDDMMADTAVRFRRNFSAAVAAADNLWAFNVDRIVEVYGADFDDTVAPFLDEMLAWCGRVKEARRRRSGLYAIPGGAA